VGLSDKLERVPVRPGVYLFKGHDGSVLYVGKARVLRDRVRSYFQASSRGRARWSRRSPISSWW
jgi:excinuclease ABC subunit C